MRMRPSSVPQRLVLRALAQNVGGRGVLAMQARSCAAGRGPVGVSLRCGRQNVVAHGGVAVATDVRAVDGSEVVVRLGRREQAAGAAVPALGRERTAGNGPFPHTNEVACV